MHRTFPPSLRWGICAGKRLIFISVRPHLIHRMFCPHRTKRIQEFRAVRGMLALCVIHRRRRPLTHDSHQGEDPRLVTNDGTLTFPASGQGVQAECPLQGVIATAGHHGPGSPARASARAPPNSKSDPISSLRQTVCRSAASPGSHQGPTYPPHCVRPWSGAQ